MTNKRRQFQKPPGTAPTTPRAKQDARRADDMERMEMALRRLVDDPDYQEYVIRPNKEQGQAALKDAMREALKPAGQRNDALVVELLRDYMTFNEIATAADVFISGRVEARRRAESPLQSEPKPPQ